MKDHLNWQDAIVLLPVPLKHASQVAEFAATLAAGLIPATAESQPMGEETVFVQGQGPWTNDMVHQLADAISYQGALALLDRCARRPGQWIPKSEVEQESAISAIQLRNELGALSKKTVKLFGQAIWPMEWRKERGVYSYRMEPAVAQWWTSARSENNS